MDILASNALHSSYSSTLQISISNKLPTTPSLGIVEAPDESQQAADSFSSFKRHLPKPPSLISALRFRGKLSSLDSVKQLHAKVVKLPKTKDSDDAVWNLIRAYLKFSDFRTSVKVFFLGLRGHTGSCASFLEEYERFGGDPYKILDIFAELWDKGVKFDPRALSNALKLCAVLTDAWLGVEIHACLVKSGFDLNVDLRSSLMDFYQRCWDAESADRVFDEMPIRNSHLWKEKIVESLKNSNPDKTLELFKKMMQASSVKPDAVTVSKTLQACGKLRDVGPGKQIHGYVFRKSMETDLWICNSLINMYSKNGEVAAARNVFDSMKTRNLSTWNSMISGYAPLGHFDEVWKLLDEMKNSPDTKPDTVTWNCLLINTYRHGLYQQVLTIFQTMLADVKPTPGSINPAIQAAGELELLDKGRELHCHVVRTGLDYDEYVVSILIELYLRFNDLDKARAVFDHSRNKNIVAWNSLVFGYASNARFDEATELVNRMKREEEIDPDIFTYNGLLSGYATNGQVEKVSTVLEQMESSGVKPNIVSWTAIISGCSKSGNFIHAFNFFREMLEESNNSSNNNNPTPATLCCLLQSCAGLSLLQTGKEIHCASLRNPRLETPLVTTALIDVYIKSGSLDIALKIFRRMKDKTVGTWNCMINGLAIHGQGQSAIDLYEKMLHDVKPDAVTFTAVLSACKNSGLIDLGWKYFDSMKSDHDITPTIEHYCCIVDLLGRSGYLDEAIDFIRSMPVKPDASVWGALLRSCRVHNNLKLGKIAAQQLFKMEPTNSTNYVHLMNLYSMAKRWREVDLLKEKMDALGIKPQRSWCWVRVGDDKEARVFDDEEAAAAAANTEEGMVYSELYRLVGEMKRKAGYVPDVECVYQNISDGDKEKVLMSHPEKLAITYGLIKKKERGRVGDGGGPIRVIKNTRMCRDCHAAAKAISVVRECEILVKDGVRFHRFRPGGCSCNDYW